MVKALWMETKGQPTRRGARGVGDGLIVQQQVRRVCCKPYGALDEPLSQQFSRKPVCFEAAI